MNEYIKTICKIGQGADCCKYLIGGVNGFECAKISTLKALVDQSWEKDAHVSQGDNCRGSKDFITEID